MNSPRTAQPAAMTRNVSDFSADDIFLHRTLSTLAGGPGQQWLVFPVRQAVRDSDGYETTLWGLRPGQDRRARRLSSPVFDASFAKLRPDGRAVAFVSKRNDDGHQAYLLPLDGGEAQQLSRAGDTRLSTLEAWSEDGKRLLATASVAWTEDGETRHANGTRPPQVATFLPYKRDGSGMTVGRRTHLYAIDADGGELHALTEGDFDVTSGAWSPDGTQLAFLRKRGGRMRHRTDLWLADAQGGGARRVVDELASIQALAWSPDGRRIALAGTRIEGDSQVGLWLVDVADGALRRIGGEDFELSTSTALEWHPDGNRIATIADVRGLHRIAVVGVDDGSLDLQSRGLRSVQALAQSGDRLAFVAMGMRRLNDVYTCDWDGGNERRLSRLNQWFLERPRPRVRKRWFSVPDGEGGIERVEAWVLLPPAPDPDPVTGEAPAEDGPRPLLVDMHGGPHSAVLVDFSAHTYWYLLLSRGWAIVAPNAVGSTGYGRRFSTRLCGHWGELDLPQYEAIVRTLQEEGIADQRLACAGKSYGGFLAAWAIGKCDLFKAAAVAAPVANVLSHMGTSDSGYYVTPHDMTCGPHDDPGLYTRLSPITWCRDATAATLILQGEDDGRCPRGQSEELFSHLVRCTDVPVELVVYPQSSHSEAESGRPGNRVDYHCRVAAWLDDHANRAGT